MGRFGIPDASTVTKAIEKPMAALDAWEGLLMRSDLVFGAMANVPNRFLLTKLASQAVRRLHRPNTRIQETANDVFVRFQRANPMAEKRDSEQLATGRLRSAA
jgi:hypothetical protein